MFEARTLAGKSIVVTGGGSGLGLAMAKTFVSYGAGVTIAGRRSERLEAAMPEIAAAAREGGEVGSVALDATRVTRWKGFKTRTTAAATA